jgi:hypothetical protein
MNITILFLKLSCNEIIIIYILILLVRMIMEIKHTKQCLFYLHKKKKHIKKCMKNIRGNDDLYSSNKIVLNTIRDLHGR